MTSSALQAWRSSRLVRLDRLLAAHPEAGGSGADPAISREWTEALVLRLASEFQGFCRDLHDAAVGGIVKTVTLPGMGTGRLMNGMVAGRGLSRRAADPKTITEDFDRLGVGLWACLSAARRDAAPLWRAELWLPHRARNGVVHDDRSAVEGVELAGRPLRIETVRGWRNLLDEIAEAMDTVVHREIADSLGINPYDEEGS